MTALAATLLNEQTVINEKLDALHIVINKAERDAMGLTLESSKTPEWHEAKRLYSKYFEQLRRINSQLNKIRTCVGYENVGGKRVAVYKHKG